MQQLPRPLVSLSLTLLQKAILPTYGQSASMGAGGGGGCGSVAEGKVASARTLEVHGWVPFSPLPAPASVAYSGNACRMHASWKVRAEPWGHGHQSICWGHHGHS